MWLRASRRCWWTLYRKPKIGENEKEEEKEEKEKRGRKWEEKE